MRNSRFGTNLGPLGANFESNTLLFNIFNTSVLLEETLELYF